MIDPMSKNVFQEKIKVPGGDALAPTDPAEFEKVVRNRRSVRIYDGSPVIFEVREGKLHRTLDLKKQTERAPGPGALIFAKPGLWGEGAIKHFLFYRHTVPWAKIFGKYLNILSFKC